MFELLGRTVVRFRWLFLVFWLALASMIVLFAPTLSTVGTSSDAAFLPDDAPSTVSEKVLVAEFPETATSGQGLLVIYDRKGLSDADRSYTHNLVEWLRSGQAPREIGSITSVFDRPELESVLVSKDKTTMLVRLDYTTPVYSDATNAAVDGIRAHIQATRPAGLDVLLSGQAAIARDLFSTIMDSVGKTTIVTIFLVILVLLFIYRSPVAAGVPLLTIGIAYLITRGVLGMLAEAGMKLSTITDAFAVVLIFGAGTDYALFLFSRYREELAKRPDHDRAGADIATVSRIGPVITASAATVIIGTSGMAIARFEMTKTQGPAMAIGIAVALLASLTLTPALLSILGKYLFWPLHTRVGDQAGGDENAGATKATFWARVAGVITTRPIWTATLVGALLLLPYLALIQFTRSFDVLSELPKTTEARQGFETVKQHFNQGEMLPVTVIITGEQSLREPANLARLDDLQASLAGVPGVARVRSALHPNPGGDESADRAFLAPEQLRAMASTLEKGVSATTSATATAGKPGSELATIRSYLKALGEGFPQVKTDPAYLAAQSVLDDLQARIDQAAQDLQVQTQLRKIAGQVGGLVQASPTPQTSQGQDSAHTLAALHQYFIDLAQAYPEVKSDPGFVQATAALEQLAKSLEAAKQQSQVSAQLGMLAGQMAGMEQTLADPRVISATPPPEQPAMSDRVGIVGSYLQELAGAYPEVKSSPAYSQSLASIADMRGILAQVAQARAMGMSGTPGQAEAIRAQLQKDAGQIAGSLQALGQPFTGRDAPFVSNVLAATPQAAQSGADLQAAVTGLQTGLGTLAKRFEGRDAPFTPRSLAALTPTGEDPAKAIAGATTNLAARLRDIAGKLPQNAYFLPDSLVSAHPALADILGTFIAKDNTATQMQVLLTDQPYSEAAINTVDRIEAVAAEKAAAWTEQPGEAGNFTSYTGGATAQVRDIHVLVDTDLPRVMALVVGGVFLVFALLLRSLIAPIYLVGTVLLSYGSTMGLITLLFKGVLGEVGVHYIVPTIILVLLVALGADYNIFLISRVWEETEKCGDVREGVRRASIRTGGVITSAGVILAGTFAALMVAPMQTLFQVGAAVALGVLVDTFIVRTLLVPALAVITGKWSWWPAMGRLARRGAGDEAAKDRKSGQGGAAVGASRPVHR